MAVDINELYRQRGKLLGEEQALLKQIEGEGRDLSIEERLQYEKIMDEVRKLGTKIAVAEEKREAERNGNGSSNNSAPWLPDPNPGYRTREEGEVRTLKPSEKLSDIYRSKEPLSMGKYIRGIVTGNWEGAENELRVMSIGTPSVGGYTVPAPLSAKIIDLARNQSRVFQAGAITVPMDSKTLSLARTLTDLTPAWKVENNAITASDMTFDQVTLTAQTLVAMAKCSVELMEDSTNLSAVVNQSLSAALALALDKAALNGSGVAPEPRGIRNQTGVQILDMGTNGLAMTDYTKFSTAVQKIQEANGNDANLAAIYAPRTAAAIDQFKETTTAQPLQPLDSFKSLKKFVTNQVPINLTHGTGTTCSQAFVGDFSQLMVGMRTNLTIEVDRTAADSTGSAFSNLQVWIRAYLRADIALMHPNHFVVIDGIL